MEGTKGSSIKEMQYQDGTNAVARGDCDSGEADMVTEVVYDGHRAGRKHVSDYRLRVDHG